MSDLQVTPTTLQLAWTQLLPSRMYIGDQTIIPQPTKGIENAYWYVVVDRTNLEVRFNLIVSDNANYPAGLKPYLGDPNMYIWISTHGVRADHLPVGELAALIQSLGATSNFTKLLQIGKQLGTPTNNLVAYYIAASADMTGQTVFDQYSYFQTDALMVPLLYAPFEFNGKTFWILGQVGA